MSLSTEIQNEVLNLIWTDQKASIRVRLDWRQRKNVGLKSDLLKRALGKTSSPLIIFDATAGLLRDALHLVQLGHRVTGFEKNQKLGSALKKALELKPIANLIIQPGDFMQEALRMDAPDVVYIDPMFPEKKKSALAGKESQLLQKLNPCPTLDEELTLLNFALKIAKARVLVKRPNKAPHLGEQKPHHKILGKAVRYDVYLTNV